MRPIDTQIETWRAAVDFYATMARECCPDDEFGWRRLCAAARRVLDALLDAKTLFDESVLDTNLLEQA